MLSHKKLLAGSNILQRYQVSRDCLMLLDTYNESSFMKQQSFVMLPNAFFKKGQHQIFGVAIFRDYKYSSSFVHRCFFKKLSLIYFCNSDDEEEIFS